MTIRFLDFATEADALRDLRMRVLYPGRSPERADYPGDAQAVHIGAFTDSGELSGCASLFHQEGDAIQLRGMGTSDAVRGTGAGLAIVRFVEGYAREQRATRLWCNARATAVGFYERCGWTKEGDEFDVA
ncbi:MAG: GNAT family N-acetyltransferase, partial [Armatimonadetes bacterium]|nr:GNAT family N-acetyltransferase [Armatimonadota bacterium]